jgi:hypothetical protein
MFFMQEPSDDTCFVNIQKCWMHFRKTQVLSAVVWSYGIKPFIQDKKRKVVWDDSKQIPPSGSFIIR